MIEVVTKKSFVKEVKHEGYRPVEISEEAPKRGRRPAAAAAPPSPQSSSSASPVPSPPLHLSSSRAAAAAPPRSRRDSFATVMKGIRSIFGMCMHNTKAQLEFEQYMRERLHRIDSRQQRLAQAANLQPPLSPERELSAPRPAPQFFYPPMFAQQPQQPFEQPLQQTVQQPQFEASQ